jgi:hypothetical protein
MFRKFLKEAHSNKLIGKLKKCIFFFACSRLFNKRHRRTRAHIVTFRRDPGAEQEEKQKEKHKLYAQTTRCTHARTKRIDFLVGVRKRINPPQPPTYMQTSTCERASLCQTYIKHTHTHARTRTHTYAHRNEKDGQFHQREGRCPVKHTLDQNRSVVKPRTAMTQHQPSAVKHHHQPANHKPVSMFGSGTF